MMIASNQNMSETPRVHNLGVVHVSSDQDVDSQLNAAERALRTTKLWVEKHPTTAVVASVVLGLLVGYVVKRRE